MCIGAGDGVRTRDLHLGKVPLYQLSHSHNTLVSIARLEQSRKSGYTLAMSNQPVPTIRRQLLGRRLGPRPDYTLSRSDAQVTLASRPDQLRRPGIRIAIGGGLLLLGALLLIISGALAAGQGGGIATVAVVTLFAGLLGGLGGRRLVGGIAVASTRNTIVADAAGRTVTYSQVNRVARERSQQLTGDQLRSLRLVSRRLLTGGLIQRRIPIVVLELVLIAGDPWIIDSAADPTLLSEVAEALATVLELEVETVAEQKQR